MRGAVGLTALFKNKDTGMTEEITIDDRKAFEVSESGQNIINRNLRK